MVKLEETTDEHFHKGAAADEEEWQDDDESEFVCFASTLPSSRVLID